MLNLLASQQPSINETFGALVPIIFLTVFMLLYESRKDIIVDFSSNEDEKG